MRLDDPAARFLEDWGLTIEQVRLIESFDFEWDRETGIGRLFNVRYRGDPECPRQDSNLRPSG